MHPLLRFFWALCLLLPTLCSTLLLISGLGVLFWLSLHEITNAADFELTYNSFNHYINLAHTHLQRQAIFNTLVVTIITTLLSLPLANLLANLLTKNWRGRWILAISILAPVTMPTALGAFAWHQLFNLLPFHGRTITLIGITVIQIWRLLPMMTAIFVVNLAAHKPSHRTKWFSPALAIALCLSIFLLLTNVSVPLIYTNGQSINTLTPFWGQWAFHLGYTSGQFGSGAANLVIMMPLLFIFIMPLPMLAGRIQLRRRWPHQDSKITFVHKVGAGCLGTFLILPLIAPFLQPLSPQTITLTFSQQLHYLFFESNYRQWLTNVSLIRGSVAFIALLFGLPAGYSLARLWGPFGRPIAAILVWVALLASPVAFIPLAWLSRDIIWADTRWLLVGFYAATTIPLAAWFTMQVLQRISYQMIKKEPATVQNRWLLVGNVIWPSLKFSVSVVLILSLGLAFQEFVTALVLSAPSSHQTLSVGVITEFAYHPGLSPALVALAICLPTCLGIFICIVALRSLVMTVKAQL